MNASYSSGLVTYRLLSRARAVGRGSTRATVGTVEAVIKEDHLESPSQVYCEIVAFKLACLIGAPVAVGVLVSHDSGLKYASLVLSQMSLSLKDVDKSRLKQLFRRYPRECARLAVLDIWIGNRDRLGNVRASLGRTEDRTFVGIDHGHSLLNCGATAAESIQFLEREAWPERHCFAAGLTADLCAPMLDRIERLTTDAIMDACTFGGVIGSVLPHDQVRLAEALDKRRKWLRSLVLWML